MEHQKPTIGIIGEIPDLPPQNLENIVTETGGTPIFSTGYTYRRESKKTGRNEPCPCGSGNKYKKCCLCKKL